MSRLADMRGLSGMSRSSQAAHPVPGRGGIGSVSARLAHEACTTTDGLCCPATGDAAAEQRGPEHRAFQAGTAIDVAAGHAGNFAGGVEAWDRIEVLVEHAAAQIGLD